MAVTGRRSRFLWRWQSTMPFPRGRSTMQDRATPGDRHWLRVACWSLEAFQSLKNLEGWKAGLLSPLNSPRAVTPCILYTSVNASATLNAGRLMPSQLLQKRVAMHRVPDARILSKPRDSWARVVRPHILFLNVGHLEPCPQ